MSIKRKILYVITKGNWGGAQKYVFDLATNIPSDEFEAVVALGQPGELERRLEAKHIRTITLPYLERDVNVSADVVVFFDLIQLMRRERPDVVHLNSAKMGALGALAARLTGVQKIIFTAHGWTFREDRSVLSTWLIKCISWITVVLCHHTITLHERDLHAFDRWLFTKGKVVKIYNGIRPEKFLSKTEARAHMSHIISYNISKEILVGTIAELHHNKGLSYLIEAIQALSAETLLCIIGEGEERKHLEALVRTKHLEHRIFFTGFIPEAHRLLKTFDLFILPSVKEGFPFVLLEAAHASLPVIATNVGGMPEIVENMKSGLLVEPRKYGELVGALSFMITHEKERVHFAAMLHARVVEIFSFEKMHKDTARLYREK